jgi:hypothetical protein
MKTAKQILNDILARIGNAGVSRAYFVAGGNELCVYDCDSQLQKLFLELQAAESVRDARERLGFLFSNVIVRRGSGFAEVRTTCCRSTKEIEESLQTAIDGIETGLSKLEEEFAGMRESYAALSNRMEKVAVELSKLANVKMVSQEESSDGCEFAEFAVERIRNARHAENLDRSSNDSKSLRYWKIVHSDSEETLGAVGADGRRFAWSAAVTAFGHRIPWELVRIGRDEFISIQKSSRRVAQFFKPAVSS